MNILFINGSPNADGNTAELAKILLQGRTYETLNLVDYQINTYGQTLLGDRFVEVLEKIKEADVLIIGSPLYWHNICGSVRNLLDRCYGPLEEGSLSGKLFFLFQGASPEKWMMEAGEFTMSRFSILYGLDYQGMATNKSEATALRQKLRVFL
jgi:multimeric flavodoxin WrbA